MKRELKLHLFVADVSKDENCKAYPDEKGIETHEYRSGHRSFIS